MQVPCATSISESPGSRLPGGTTQRPAVNIHPPQGDLPDALICRSLCSHSHALSSRRVSALAPRSRPSFLHDMVTCPQASAFTATTNSIAYSCSSGTPPLSLLLEDDWTPSDADPWPRICGPSGGTLHSRRVHRVPGVPGVQALFRWVQPCPTYRSMAQPRASRCVVRLSIQIAAKSCSHLFNRT